MSYRRMPGEVQTHDDEVMWLARQPLQTAGTAAAQILCTQCCCELSLHDADTVVTVLLCSTAIASLAAAINL